MLKKDWENLEPGSALRVIAHAAWAKSKGRKPSMAFGNITNPVKALAAAKDAAKEQSNIQKLPKNRKIKGRELNVLAYIPWSEATSDGGIAYGHAEISVTKALRGPQLTVIRDLDALMAYLEQSDILPDLIWMHDKTVPSSGGLLGMDDSMRLDAISMMMGNTVIPEENMPGVEALTILKAEESAFKNIPVFVNGVFDSKIFTRRGALDAFDVFEADYCLHTVGRHLGIEFEDEDEDVINWFEAPHLESITILEEAPKEKDTTPRPNLEGDQINQFENFLRREAITYSEARAVREFMDDPGMQRYDQEHMGCFSLELQSRGEDNVANVLSTILNELAEKVASERMNDRKIVIGTVDQILESMGEPTRQLMLLMTLDISGKAYRTALKTVSDHAISSEFSDDQIKLARAMIGTRIAYFNKTKSLGIKAATEGVELAGHQMSDEAQEFFDTLDEEKVAKDSAKHLEQLDRAIAENKPQSSYDLRDMLRRIVPEERGASVAPYALDEVIQELSKIDGDNIPSLSKKEIRQIKTIIDRRIQSEDLGPKTKALLFAVSDILSDGITITHIEDTIKVLGQLEDYADKSHISVRTALNEFDKVLRSVRGEGFPGHRMEFVKVDAEQEENSIRNRPMPKVEISISEDPEGEEPDIPAGAMRLTIGV